MEIRSWHFIVAMVAGWLRREQQAVIEYLKEENKVLREQMGGKRLRFTDAQRRRLARKGKLVGRRGLHAFAERFVLSIKSECLSRLVLLGEAHLRLAVREYVAHYNEERPHQGLDGRFVAPPANENRAGEIECNKRLGGLLRYYRRRAA